MKRASGTTGRRAGAILFLVLALAPTACASGGGGPALKQVSFAPSLDVQLDRMTRLPSGVYVQDLVQGVGEEAGLGNQVRIQYVGWLADGTRFDSSLQRGEPLQFRLGRDEVISGWDAGIRGMKEGGQRLLVVPPSEGYGARGAGDAVPPNAVLVFRVQLLEVR